MLTGAPRAILAIDMLTGMQRDPQSVTTCAMVGLAASQLHRADSGMSDDDVTGTYAAIAGWDLALGNGRRYHSRNGPI